VLAAEWLARKTSDERSSCGTAIQSQVWNLVAAMKARARTTCSKAANVYLGDKSRFKPGRFPKGRAFYGAMNRWARGSAFEVLLQRFDER